MPASSAEGDHARGPVNGHDLAVAKPPSGILRREHSEEPVLPCDHGRVRQDSPSVGDDRAGLPEEDGPRRALLGKGSASAPGPRPDRNVSSNGSTAPATASPERSPS